AGLLEDLVGLVGLARVRVLLADVLRADHLADRDRGDHEREPAEDGGLPVARAPAAHPGREVVRALQGGHSRTPSAGFVPGPRVAAAPLRANAAGRRLTVRLSVPRL